MKNILIKRSDVPSATFISDFWQSGERTFDGYVANAEAPETRYVVEILVAGIPVKTVRADQFVAALSDVGDGHYGFTVSLSPSMVQAFGLVEARVANLGVPLSRRSTDGQTQDETPETGASSSIEWRGGLRFTGWLSGNQATGKISCFVNGAAVQDVRPSGWKSFGSSFKDAFALPAFDFHLPIRFADGRVRTLRVVDQTGAELRGSPLKFVDYGDKLKELAGGLAEIDSERLRTEMFGRLFPRSVPFSHYPDWQRRFPNPAPAVASKPIAVVIVGSGSVERSIESLEASKQEWVACHVENGDGSDGAAARMLKEFLIEEAQHCSAVIFARAGVEFSEDCLDRFASAIDTNPDATLVYGDVSIRGVDGSLWPVAFPAFDYERMLEQGYCANLFATKRTALQKRQNQSALNLFEIAFALIDDPSEGSASIVHIPGSCGIMPTLDLEEETPKLRDATARHLARRRIKADVSEQTGTLMPAVRVARRPSVKSVSVVIPTRNRVELLKRCISSIQYGVVKAAGEIVVVDNDSSDPETLAFLREIEADGVRIVRAPGPFNFSRLNNVAVKQSSSNLICLLNNDVEATDENWLIELCSRIEEPTVGAVGALLVQPSGVIQHGGVVLGSNFAATHAFIDRMADDPGYTDLLRVAHQCSAVTAACLITRRSDYLQLGGLDERLFPIDFNDVDYCLRLGEIGKRIVFSPHAKLLHLESASRGQAHDKSPLFKKTLENLRARWLDTLLDDPYYNPTLSLDAIPFTALAWPPRNMSPRLPKQPDAVTIPGGIS